MDDQDDVGRVDDGEILDVPLFRTSYGYIVRVLLTVVGVRKFRLGLIFYSVIGIVKGVVSVRCQSRTHIVFCHRPPERILRYL